MIDAHAHLISNKIMSQAFKDWGVSEQKTEEFIKDIDFNAKQLKDAWIKTLDENNIEKVVFMGASPNNKEFINTINSSDKFEGFTSVNPTQDNALEKVKQDISKGMKGIKLYPSARGFSVADKKAYSLYQYCAKNNIPIIIHFGITIGPKSDLRYGNPIDLSPVLTDFPDQRFVIAHFGAGFFREALMLTYKRNNVYFDTSGTNNWLCYHPRGLNLVDVFKQTLDLVGPQRVIFGTDSRLIVDEYRKNILDQQKEILSKLLKSKEVDMVMGGNARRIYNI
ncbi:MAG: amidohydrolase family protein [Elusimicrobiota bacterium]